MVTYKHFDLYIRVQKKQKNEYFRIVILNYSYLIKPSSSPACQLLILFVTAFKAHPNTVVLMADVSTDVHS